jgi:hypothetical protein
MLFQEGSLADQFYIVLDGQVEISKAPGTADEELKSAR